MKISEADAHGDNRPRGAKGKKDKAGVRTRSPVIPQGKGRKEDVGKQECGIRERRNRKREREV